MELSQTTAERERELADIRAWLAGEPADPTVEELARPLMEAFDCLHWPLREHCQAHVSLVEIGSLAGITVGELEAARAHLALHHRLVDQLAGLLACWTPHNAQVVVAPSVRQGLYAAFGTEDLALALYCYDQEPTRATDAGEQAT